MSDDAKIGAAIIGAMLLFAALLVSAVGREHRTFERQCRQAGGNPVGEVCIDDERRLIGVRP